MKPGRSRSPISLSIDALIADAERLASRVRNELPSHDGLGSVADATVEAARRAQGVVRAMHGPLSLHRLPVYFLGLALVTLAVWLYVMFFQVSSLTLALPERDAVTLRQRALDRRVHFEIVSVPGSRESAALLNAGKVDLAFVQGGIELPAHLARRETPGRELVLLFLREGLAGPARARRILTSLEGEGSHTVALAFARAWGTDGDVTFIHDWTALTAGHLGVLADVDAVFVVKDPASNEAQEALSHLESSGFRLASPELGARARLLDYLSPTSISRGFLRPDPPLPAEPVASYGVATFLVARAGLTPRLLALAGQIFESHAATIPEGPALSASQAMNVFQGADALLGIVVNIGLGFIALLGLDGVMWRKRFHELNSLVSLLSMHQSNKDVLGLEDGPRRRDNLLYLALCSDLLGLLGAVSSYYTQENSSLLFGNLAEVVHQRCDALKLNIQLKILHATVPNVRTAT